jgi:hypothetical protein
MARPAWDAAAGVLRLTDLSFVFDAVDQDQGLAAGLFYERIRSALDRAANDLLQVRTRQMREGIEDGLSRTAGQVLPARFKVALAGSGLRELRVEVGATGMRLSGSAGGDLRVSLGEAAPAGR